MKQIIILTVILVFLAGCGKQPEYTPQINPCVFNMLKQGARAFHEGYEVRFGRVKGKNGAQGHMWAEKRRWVLCPDTLHTNSGTPASEYHDYDGAKYSYPTREEDFQYKGQDVK
jgi:hypothetical protein